MELKLNNNIIRYVLLVILIPISFIVLKYWFWVILEIGKYYGTFLRNIFEITSNLV